MLALALASTQNTLFLQLFRLILLRLVYTYLASSTIHLVLLLTSTCRFLLGLKAFPKFASTKLKLETVSIFNIMIHSKQSHIMPLGYLALLSTGECLFLLDHFRCTMSVLWVLFFVQNIDLFKIGVPISFQFLSISQIQSTRFSSR